MTSFTGVRALRLGRLDRLAHRSRAHTISAPGGVPVTIAPSWLLGVGLAAWTVADAFLPDAVPGRSAVAYATTGLAAAAALALTIALHEAAHAAVARRAGLRVRGITLSFFGGSLELAEGSTTPGVEARVALAGPLASALAALLATGLHVVFVLTGVDPLLSTAAAVVAIGNLLVAGFNCVPALPLDGGRALRAALWALTGREATGARAAAIAGRALGALLLLVAMVAAASGDTAIALWFALLGLSLHTG